MTEDAVHFPSLSEYKIIELFRDLLIFSVRHLKMDGRLVFWFPVPDKYYDDSIFPQHSALKLIANSKQQLVGDTSRILLTYEKISEDGEIIGVGADLDFREKYFSQFNKDRREQRNANHQRNIEEAEKRGITLFTKTDWKKYMNKKRHDEQE